MSTEDEPWVVSREEAMRRVRERRQKKMELREKNTETLGGIWEELERLNNNLDRIVTALYAPPGAHEEDYM